MSNRPSGTGSVYEDRKRGLWIGEAVIDGRRRRTSARTKTEASKRITKLIRDAEHGINPGDGTATVATLLDLWRARVLPNRELSPSAVDNYDRALRMLDAEFGRVRLRSLDVDRIERGLDRIATGTVGTSRGRPLSRRSLKLFRSTLAQVLDLGVRRKLIAGNPARTAELTPKRRQDQAPPLAHAG